MMQALWGRGAMWQWEERRDLLGYTVEELRDLVREGLESGPSRHASLDEVKTEARRRLATASGPDR